MFLTVIYIFGAFPFLSFAEQATHAWRMRKLVIVQPPKQCRSGPGPPSKLLQALTDWEALPVRVAFCIGYCIRMWWAW